MLSSWNRGKNVPLFRFCTFLHVISYTWPSQAAGRDTPRGTNVNTPHCNPSMNARCFKSLSLIVSGGLAVLVGKICACLIYYLFIRFAANQTICDVAVVLHMGMFCEILDVLLNSSNFRMGVCCTR